MSSAARLLAVDVGGTRVRVALGTPAGDLLAEAVEATTADGGRALIAQIGRMARALGSDAAAAGVGVPGVPHRSNGRIHGAPNVRDLDTFDVAAALRDELAMPVAVENDVNIATLGEGWRGHGRDLDDWCFLAVGTGVGLGVVAAGRLVRGHTGAAGEIAWLPVGLDPFDPANRRRGSLEEAAGGVGIAARYGHDATGRDVHRAAERGDSAASQLLREQDEALAKTVLTIRCMLDPALIVLGGGIGTLPDVARRIGRQLARLTGPSPDGGGPPPGEIAIKPSRLGERAALYGGVYAALELAT